MTVLDGNPETQSLMRTVSLLSSHTSRTFHNVPGAGYILPSDDIERARLQLQHQILKDAFDGKIVLAPFKLNDDTSVLDSGTGTGAWILDFAAHAPESVALQGIDIQSKLFPKSLPPNVTLSLGSALSLPPDWSEKFDFVHQRLLIAALRDTEWPTALQEAMRVLKGGGWLQLTEPGTWTSGEATSKLSSLRRQLYSARGLVVDIALELPRLLTECGFTNIQVDKRRIELGMWAGERGKMARDTYMCLWRAQKTAILRLDGLGHFSSEEELDRFLDSLEREWEDIEDSYGEFFTFCAQKPLIQAL